MRSAAVSRSFGPTSMPGIAIRQVIPSRIQNGALRLNHRAAGESRTRAAFGAIVVPLSRIDVVACVTIDLGGGARL